MLKSVGTPLEEAEIVTEILVSASLRGVDSHGLRNLPRYIDRIEKKQLMPGAPIKILHDTPTTALWDAGSGFGFVAGKRAMETAIEKAKKYKIGSVGTKNGGHVGALFWYSMLAVKNDMIGITLCKAGYNNVAPYGGVEGRLGTNPLSVAIPAGKEKPIMLDMATTGVAAGHMAIMALRGEKAPEGWLIRPDGTWSTDPSSPRKGEASHVAFGHPYGEYKGYGLSVIIEALAGAIGSGFSINEIKRGHLFFAIDPSGYCPIEEFTARIDSMIRNIKSSKKRPGFKEILLPGEPEWQEEEKRKEEGIFLDDLLWENILTKAKDLGINVDSIMT
jgi:LDH2 family malate/lactate/ureidoglycolate dehydrogenase